MIPYAISVRLISDPTLVTTSADANNVIPFYMLPTLGGQDIDSRISLRGYENYRFRAPDAMFVQAEYSLPIYDPLALLLFSDPERGDPFEGSTRLHSLSTSATSSLIRIQSVGK